MSIASWVPKKDNAEITLECRIPLIPDSESKRFEHPWSIPQPNLHGLFAKKTLECQEATAAPLIRLRQEFLLALPKAPNKLACADYYSKESAKSIIETVGIITGSKRATHRKGKFETSDIVRSQAEISTITKARDLIRTLWLNEVHLDQRTQIEAHLVVLLDRLVAMGLTSVLRTLDIVVLHEWGESVALTNIQTLRNYIRQRKADLISIERLETRRLFLDPKKRGQWLDHIFGTKRSVCPNYAIDPSNGARLTDPEQVKDLYFREGTRF